MQPTASMRRTWALAVSTSIARARVALVLTGIVLIAGCASVPTDPNLAALAASNERLQSQQLAHAEAA